LKISSDKCKDFYVELKNGLNSYKGFTFRMSGRLEKVNYHGETIAMIGVVRKALKLWLALDPNAYDFERYHQKDASDKKRYEHVPMQVRIGSARALKRAEELLDRLLENYQAEVRNKYKPKNLQELAYTLKLNKLVKDKRNDLLYQSIHVHDADVISDEDAERYVELRERAPIADENFAVVSLDTLDTEFLDGNKVTLDKLKKKGIIPEECNGYYLTAGKRLSKPLYVIADEISPSAVKMIVLTGGRAIELVAPQQTETEQVQ
jgi:ribosomal protein L15